MERKINFSPGIDNRDDGCNVVALPVYAAHVLLGVVQPKVDDEVGVTLSCTVRTQISLPLRGVLRRAGRHHWKHQGRGILAVLVPSQVLQLLLDTRQPLAAATRHRQDEAGITC